MNKRIDFLGVVPARGGSKGIPRKNIKPIAGKPLIAWSIEAAAQSRLLDRFVVSTEDEEIAVVARSFGAEVLNRPHALASDEASTLSVLQHVLTVIDAAAVVLLQPTSPVRNAGLIDACIARFKAADADNLATGFICKFMPYGSYHQRRQELKGFFYDDGNVYVIKSEVIKSGKMQGAHAECMEISKEQSCEIDDEFDFWLNEQILLKQGHAKVGST